MPKHSCPSAMKLLLISCIVSALTLPTGAVNRCGRSYAAAAKKCSKCPKGIDSECAAGETCYAGLPACKSGKPAGGSSRGTVNRCGSSYSAAAKKCKKCPKGIDSECAAGETCYAGLPACSATPITPTKPTRPPHSTKPHLSGYVALGDSYAAGIGNAKSTWDHATVNKCKRSHTAWPELVKAGLHARGDSGAAPFSFTACSGATITDVSTQDQGHNLSNTTKYVSISIGGNDLDFSDVILKCATFLDFFHRKGSCAKYVKEQESKIPGLKPRLATFYQRVKHLAPHARIFVMGYPYLLSHPYVLGPKKFGWHSINADEVAALRNAVNKADDMIKETCAENGVTFVDTRATFDGHGCEGRDEWINCVVCPELGRIKSLNLHPIKIAKDCYKHAKDQSFHPKQAGNKEYARLLLAAIR